MKSNLHAHTPLCDGKSDPRVILDEAIREGFSSFGYSSHAPTPLALDWTLSMENLPVYMSLLEDLKREYEGRIQFYRGLEIDYLKDAMGSSSKPFADLPLDYTIGSVHYVSGLRSSFPLPGRVDLEPPVLETYDNDYIAFSIEEAPGDLLALSDQIYGGDKRQLVIDYYRNMKDMLRHHRPDILGHFDLIKKNNRAVGLFDEGEAWYRDAVFSVLDVLRETGVIMEINLGGMARGKVDEPYPSPWIIKEAVKMDIPLTLSADIHQAGKLNYGYDDMAGSLRTWGCDYLWHLYDKEFQALPL